jgi:hypothetical protein
MMERELDVFRLREAKELDKMIIGRIITCISILSISFCNYSEH